jgi:hypothetical protein
MAGLVNVPYANRCMAMVMPMMVMVLISPKIMVRIG